MLKTRSQLLEFILNMLSNPWFSSTMSWEGMEGQFTIIRPEHAAQLWGERNGRRSMTYQKFSRALRYYYHKKVLTKIRGRKHTYKFNFQELERQYGYRGISSVTWHQSTGNNRYRIPHVMPAIHSVPWWGSFHTKYMTGLLSTFLIHTSSGVWMGLIWS